MNGIKGIALILVAVFVVSGAVMFMASDDSDAARITDDQGVTYETRADGTAIVYKCDEDAEGDIVIPKKISYEGKDYPIVDVGSQAFGYCDGITSISMPHITKITGSNAFRGCDSLTILDIPKVEYLDYFAISYMDSLKVLEIPSLKEMYMMAICYLESLEYIYVPSLEKVDTNRFYHCLSLETIDVGPDNPHFSTVDGALYSNDMTELYNFPFGRSGEFTVPDTVITVKEDAFAHCEGLTKLYMPSVTVLEYSSIYDLKSLDYVFMPKLESIGAKVFTDTPSLESLDIGYENGYFVVEGGALYNKDKTELLVFPCGISGSFTVADTVEVIDDLVINSVRNLTELYMPSVRVIHQFSVYEMESLEYIFMPKLESIMGGISFFRTPSLKSLDVGDDNDYFTTVDGILYDKDVTRLIRCPEGKGGTVTMPDTVETLGDSSFYGCNIAELIVSSSVRALEDYALSNAEIDVLDMSGATSLEYLGTSSIFEVLSEIIFSTSDWISDGFAYGNIFYDENGDRITEISGATVGGMTFVLQDGIRYVPKPYVPEDDSMQYVAIGAVIFAIVAILSYLAYRRD